MALTVLELLANDVNYISKHNTNYTAIKAAIDALQSAIGGVSGGEGSAAVLYEALMAGANGAIGASSYTPTDSATAHILNIAAGYAYDEATDTITTLATATTLNFTGQTTGTYYIHADQLGSPYYDQITEGSLYSVAYDQSTGNFTSIARTGGLYYSAADLANLQSNLWSIDYATADARVDGAEKAAIYVLEKTVVASPITLTDAEAFEQSFLYLNDGPQTDNIVLTVPAQVRVYMVSNDCSSTYSVTLTPDGGTGYAIPGKSFAVVFVNGSTAEPLFLLDLTTGASPVNTFLQLDDVDDNTYSGKAGYLARVNSTPDGMELWDPDYLTETVADLLYAPIGSTGGAEDFTDLGDVPSSYASGDVGKLVRVNATYTGLEFYSAPSWITTTGVTYEALNGNSDVGTGATQVAAGNHTHTGYGDVSGPASASDEHIAVFDSTTGKLIKDGGVAIADLGGGTGDVVGPASATDGNFVSFDEATGKLVKDSGFSPADLVFLPSFFWEGTPTASQLMCDAMLVGNVTFATNLAGSYGEADTAATAQTDFDVQYDGSSVGTIRWAAAATVPSFIAASPIAGVAGKRVKIYAPATPDATLAGISVTIKGVRA